MAKVTKRDKFLLISDILFICGIVVLYIALYKIGLWFWSLPFILSFGGFYGLILEEASNG